MHVQRIRSIRAKQENNDQYTTHIMQGLRDIFHYLRCLFIANSAINWQIRGLYLPSLATSAQVETVPEYEMSFNLKIVQYWIIL